MDVFPMGTRISWQGRPGFVAWSRLGPELAVDAYSIVLDDQKDRPDYFGTIVRADEVSALAVPGPLPEVPEVKEEKHETQ